MSKCAFFVKMVGIMFMLRLQTLKEGENAKGGVVIGGVPALSHFSTLD